MVLHRIYIFNTNLHYFLCNFCVRCVWDMDISWEITSIGLFFTPYPSGPFAVVNAARLAWRRCSCRSMREGSERQWQRGWGLMAAEFCVSLRWSPADFLARKLQMVLKNGREQWTIRVCKMAAERTCWSPQVLQIIYTSSLKRLK